MSAIFFWLQCDKMDNSDYFVPSYLSAVLLEFREKTKRSVTLDTLEEDKTTLSKLRTEVLDKLKVTNKQIVPEDFAKWVYCDFSFT